MSGLRFTKDHEWVRLEGDTVVVGVSAHAAEQLGDVVYVELPEVGAVFAQGAEMAVVESVKAASDVYAPVGGEVLEVNTAIAEEPAKVNEDPQGAGWFVKLKPAAASEAEALMDEAAYETFLKES